MHVARDEIIEFLEKICDLLVMQVERRMDEGKLDLAFW